MNKINETKSNTKEASDTVFLGSVAMVSGWSYACYIDPSFAIGLEVDTTYANNSLTLGLKYGRIKSAT